MRLFNYRFFKTLQFWLGLLLAVVAFVGVSLYARMINPDPYQVIVARQEIPAYTLLDNSMLSLDKQHINPSLANRYLTGPELAEFLSQNAVVVETIHVGEPLSKQRLAVGPDALKVSRLALALQEPDKVVRTIPVKADQFPGGVVAGDLVDLYVTFGSAPAGEISYTRTVTAAGSLTPTPAPTPPAPDEDEGEGQEAVERVEEYSARLPLSKRLVSGLLVVRVNHKMVQNPNYGLGAEGDQPAYIEGEVSSLDVLLGGQEAEKLDFALTNGKVNVGVRSALARQSIEQGTPVPPSGGWTWTDFERSFFEERLALTPTPQP